MASKVMIFGEKCQGVIEFENAEDAKDFYFNIHTKFSQCNNLTLMHDDEQYKPREKLELK